MLIIKLRNKNGKLDYVDPKDKIKQKLFLEKVSEGEIVEVLFTIQHNKASSAQISKLHACIRQLAGEIGYTFDEMKNIIKIQTGMLVINKDEILLDKSFGDCSKEEISMAIQTCEELAQEQGIILG